MTSSKESLYYNLPVEILSFIRAKLGYTTPNVCHRNPNGFSLRVLSVTLTRYEINAILHRFDKEIYQENCTMTIENRNGDLVIETVWK